MNRFFRISFTLMAMISSLVSEISGKGVTGAAGTVVAAKALKGSNNNSGNDSQPTPTQGAASAQQAAAPAPAPAPQAVMQTTGQLKATPLTKMEKIIKHVTSRAYPYRCAVFAGDYCRRLCARICVPPL